MKICIFCSANQQIDPDFFRMTEELGQWATREGHTIVFGGVNQGLMECVGKAAHEAGGRTIGVIPRIVEKSGRISDYVDIEMLCDNLSDRKQMMEDQSDVFVALPGGIGTIDELFTIAAAHTIGYHNKLVILYNMKGFWDSLIAMLDDLQQKSHRPWPLEVRLSAMHRRDPQVGSPPPCLNCSIASFFRMDSYRW